MNSERVLCTAVTLTGMIVRVVQLRAARAQAAQCCYVNLDMLNFVVSDMTHKLCEAPSLHTTTIENSLRRKTTPCHKISISHACNFIL